MQTTCLRPASDTRTSTFYAFRINSGLPMISTSSQRFAPGRNEPFGRGTGGHGATVPARPAHLGTANRCRLLGLLRSLGPCSQTDLVRASGLSATTVSSSVGRLSRLGVIETSGDGIVSGGRPSEQLRFNDNYSLVAAADIGGTRLRMMLADLSGKVVAEWTTEFSEKQKTPSAVVKLIASGLQQMINRSGRQLRVGHMTVGAPGITDVRNGTVVAAPNLDAWVNVPLRALVEQELQLPATVENDTNLAAVGERARGVAQGTDDFVFIAIGTGVGAGIFLRGGLHHGATWSAGEIGYLPVPGLPRQAVRLEETGQLERCIGGAGVESSWRALLERNHVGPESELFLARATQVFDLAEQGHELALQVLQEVARVLAGAIEVTALLFNPQMVVLGGGVGSHPGLCRATEQWLQGSCFAQPVLRSSLLGTQAQLFGALTVALNANDALLLC